METYHGMTFGIGCEYFDTEGEDIDYWKKVVTETLDAIPSVSGLKFHAMTSNRISNGRNFPANGYTDFTLSIPRRLQDEISPFGWLPSHFGEIFRVITFYNRRHPVTFVLAVNSQGGTYDGGFLGIAIVREFLKRELSARSGRARQVTVGPSPFHVDASVAIASDGQAEPFQFEVTRRPGYDRYKFACSEALFPSLESGTIALFTTLSEELSLFYSLVIKHDARRESAREIADQTEQLLQLYGKRTPWGILYRFFIAGSTQRRLSLKAIMTESAIQKDLASSQAALTEHYARNQFPCFKQYLDEEASTTYATDLSTARSIASVLEGTRGRQIEAASLFFSAIAGGLAGVLASVLIH